MKISINHNGMKVTSKMQHIIWLALYFIVYIFLVKMQRRYFADLEELLGGAIEFLLPVAAVLIAILIEHFIYREDPLTGDKYLKKYLKINK